MVASFIDGGWELMTVLRAQPTELLIRGALLVGYCFFQVIMRKA